MFSRTALSRNLLSRSHVFKFWSDIYIFNLHWTSIDYRHYLCLWMKPVLPLTQICPSLRSRLLRKINAQSARVTKSAERGSRGETDSSNWCNLTFGDAKDKQNNRKKAESLDACLHQHHISVKHHNTFSRHLALVSNPKPLPWKLPAPLTLYDHHQRSRKHPFPSCPSFQTAPSCPQTAKENSWEGIFSGVSPCFEITF